MSTVDSKPNLTWIRSFFHTGKPYWMHCLGAGSTVGAGGGDVILALDPSSRADLFSDNDGGELSRVAKVLWYLVLPLYY